MHAELAPRPLGRTGFVVGRLGVGSSYGLDARGVERAFAQGVNYFYWGSLRREGFGEGLRRILKQRERVFLVVQSYARLGMWLRVSVERALRRLGTDYTNMLLLGLWNKPVSPRILEAALRLKEKGRVRHLGVSAHRRANFAALAATGHFDVFHVRYNAAHPGAEREVFPLLESAMRPGIVTFTTTSWGQLLEARNMPAGERTPTATECYRFALSHPAVDVAMSGPADETQLEQALQALKQGPLTAEEMAWMRRVGEHVWRVTKPRFR